MFYVIERKKTKDDHLLRKLLTTLLKWKLKEDYKPKFVFLLQKRTGAFAKTKDEHGFFSVLGYRTETAEVSPIRQLLRRTQQGLECVEKNKYWRTIKDCSHPPLQQPVELGISLNTQKVRWREGLHRLSSIKLYKVWLSSFAYWYVSQLPLLGNYCSKIDLQSAYMQFELADEHGY